MKNEIKDEIKKYIYKTFFVEEINLFMDSTDFIIQFSTFKILISIPLKLNDLKEFKRYVYRDICKHILEYYTNKKVEWESIDFQ